MNQQKHLPTTEELKNLETDPVWTLLEEASSPKASPMFADSVMNEIKAAVPNNVVTTPSFWKRYSLPISAAAVAGIAAVVMLTLSSEDPMSDNSGDVAQTQTTFSDEDVAFITEEIPFEDLIQTSSLSEIDLLAEQMIEIENEDPIFMSADEIDVLVSM